MIIVRIWTSHANLEIEGKGVGHVSIQTTNEYISLWPEFGAVGRGKKLANTVDYQLLESYSADLKYEGREPEVVHSFYTLDEEAVEYKFDTIKAQLSGWCSFGNCENAESCVSLAYELLVAGGINQLLGGDILSVLKKGSIASRGASKGGSHFFRHTGASSGYSITSNTEQTSQYKERSSRALLYSLEMSVSPIIKSPDFFAQLIKTAKSAEWKKAQKKVSSESDFMAQKNDDAKLTLAKDSFQADESEHNMCCTM